MPKPIFNSLGSNYSFAFAWDAFRQLWSAQRKDLSELSGSLEDQFGGKVFLFYKGRDAIEFSVRVLEEGKKKVLTQAFTCHAIEEAITRAGAETSYVDLEKDGLNTLGVPADIEKIKRYCSEENITLIEDLAQAFGGSDLKGQRLGTSADVVIFSFGRDKIIDAVSGGAVIFKRSKDIQKATELYKDVAPHLPVGVLQKDMTYPLLTWTIRQTHQWGIGKIIFKLAKAVGWLTSPIAAPTTTMTKLSPTYAHLAVRQLKTVDAQLSHRRKIAEYYHQAFQEKNSFYKTLITEDQIKKSSNIRYSLRVEQPDTLTKKLTHQGIFITDRWYRKPVDYGSLDKTTSYLSGSCPNAEILSQHIINLPTHYGIRQADAQRIITAIKENQDV
jgi:dTDP-4-amino-4,6-dideoxygalactose transaminase